MSIFKVCAEDLGMALVAILKCNDGKIILPRIVTRAILKLKTNPDISSTMQQPLKMPPESLPDFYLPQLQN
jgi:hypothetical protein